MWVRGSSVRRKCEIWQWKYGGKYGKKDPVGGEISCHNICLHIFNVIFLKYGGKYGGKALEIMGLKLLDFVLVFVFLS